MLKLKALVFDHRVTFTWLLYFLLVWYINYPSHNAQCSMGWSGISMVPLLLLQISFGKHTHTHSYSHTHTHTHIHTHTRTRTHTHRKKEKPRQTHKLILCSMGAISKHKKSILYLSMQTCTNLQCFQMWKRKDWPSSSVSTNTMCLFSRNWGSSKANSDCSLSIFWNEN